MLWHKQGSTNFESSCIYPEGSSVVSCYAMWSSSLRLEQQSGIFFIPETWPVCAVVEWWCANYCFLNTSVLWALISFSSFLLLPFIPLSSPSLPFPFSPTGSLLVVLEEKPLVVPGIEQDQLSAMQAPYLLYCFFKCLLYFLKNCLWASPKNMGVTPSSVFRIGSGQCLVDHVLKNSYVKSKCSSPLISCPGPLALLFNLSLYFIFLYWKYKHIFISWESTHFFNIKVL